MIIKRTQNSCASFVHFHRIMLYIGFFFNLVSVGHAHQSQEEEGGIEQHPDSDEEGSGPTEVKQHPSYCIYNKSFTFFFFNYNNS